MPIPQGISTATNVLQSVGISAHQSAAHHAAVPPLPPLQQGPSKSTTVQESRTSDIHPSGIPSSSFVSPIALELMGQPPLNTKGLSREKLLAACKILKEVHTDMREIRQEMYQLNDRLNNDILMMEHVFQRLMR